LQAVNEKELTAELAALRLRWREVRERRLSHKLKLVRNGADTAAVRHDREYKRFKKEQRRVTRLARHLEQRLNRKRARHEKEE
jgi:hypothetical protein